MLKQLLMSIFFLVFVNGAALACDFSDAINFAQTMHPNYTYEGMSSSTIVVDYQEIEIYLANFRDSSLPNFTNYCSRVIVCDPNNNTYQLMQMSCRGVAN